MSNYRVSKREYHPMSMHRVLAMCGALRHRDRKAKVLGLMDFIIWW